MSTTVRAVHDSVKNVLDYLMRAELALYANAVTIASGRISFAQHDRDATFLIDREHPGIDQYLAWLAAGAYSAVLRDGSLLQLTYDIRGRDVFSHRLAYVPCPYQVDEGLLASGEPIADVIELYRDDDALLRSPVRFDFDPAASGPGHPAAHITINASHCRIACVAPVHALRFTDFVYRHFYPDLWNAHRPFFDSAAWQHLGEPVLVDADRVTPHLMWDYRARMTSYQGRLRPNDV